ncbi:hypothetical protein [Streptomyces sp. NBC_00572]|uniref:AMIN-like domain-containing (lipo)protein n=1 Tax=Streptomyces sp. NBC_00572 TaxID=2903664 RepID=UPI0022502F01|nr:hypothetical protein [Streptomyces sp. NBC_00572]MCX4981478.1 AMIN domain-containing protein [Streptomyces sp. NBC_00572]
MRTSRRTWARIASPLAALALASVFALPQASAATSVGAGSASVTATCSDVCVLGTRAATHTGYDRLVFDLSASPQVTTWTNTTGEYVPNSGKTEYLEIKGTSYLFLTMERAHLYDDAGNLAFTSPALQALNLPSVKGVQLLGEFEGRVEFGITLGPSTSHQVFKLTQPNRLVVDVYR